MGWSCSLKQGCRTACTACLSKDSKEAVQPPTHVMASRHICTTAAKEHHVNRAWHKGEHKTLEKGIRPHNGTSAQQETVGKLF